MTTFDKDKMQKLEVALAQIKKKLGDEGKVHMGAESVRKIDIISTGCLPLDVALRVGGVPRGRVTEIYGPEASGKTTFAYSVIAQAQRMGELCAFVDVEQAVDPTYAANLGVDFDHMPLIQPDSAEEALDTVELLAASGAVSVIVLDSVAALVTQAEIDGEMADMQVGSQARLMNKAMRKLTPIVKRNNVIVIFINQLRAKVNTMGYGPNEVTSGGNALKYYASVRLDIRRIKTEKNSKGEALYNVVRVKVIKNKVAPPYGEAILNVYFGTGFDRAGGIIDEGIKVTDKLDKKGRDPQTDILPVVKTGNHYTFMENEESRRNGRPNARKYLLDHPELMDEMENYIRSRAIQVIERPATASDTSEGGDQAD
jgi:recombination protein RecA